MDNCKRCGNCCHVLPCAIKPTELKTLASYFNISISEYIKLYCITDYWEEKKGNLYYLSHKRKGDLASVASYSWAFTGVACIHLDKNNICNIYSMRPHVAKICDCTQNYATPYKLEYYELWKTYYSGENIDIKLLGGL